MTKSGRDGNCEVTFNKTYARRGVLRSGLGVIALPILTIVVHAEDWGSPDPKRPLYVEALETQYGAPSQSGFGSSVLFASAVNSRAELERLALAAYRHFTGELWDKWGEAAWMGPWRLLLARSAAGDIAADLRQLSDPVAQSSGNMLLETVPDPNAAQASLAAAFDHAAVRDLLVFNLGDGGAMSGLLIAARRENGEAVFLVFLMD